MAWSSAAADPLPSWNDGKAKQSIIDFVARVTKAGGPDFVPVAERIATFRNSDGDFEMFELTTSGAGLRFGLIVHRDDADREYAYDRKAGLARLDRSLDEVPKRGWVVIDMNRDWKVVWPDQK